MVSADYLPLIMVEVVHWGASEAVYGTVATAARPPPQHDARAARTKQKAAVHESERELISGESR